MRRRATSIAGSCVGAVVFPIILAKLLDETDIGFGWSVRICAFVMLPFLIFSSVAIRERLPPRATKFLLLDAFKQPLFVVLVAASFFLFVGMFIPQLAIKVIFTTLQGDGLTDDEHLRSSIEIFLRGLEPLATPPASTTGSGGTDQ